ncbi:hypothetical protein E2C01_098922 [Portunus trituberculatus]|uniref:Uncharacterized protein n=1 Tax=Portunus trituberculatus TaxID=210409 RepID=A0A5B7K457_PORTR|nr:hypothetical protein [Portunus trituberculatus]
MISLPVNCTSANRSTFSMDVILSTNEMMRKDATTQVGQNRDERKGACTEKAGLPSRSTGAGQLTSVGVHGRSRFKLIGAGSLLQPTFRFARFIPRILGRIYGFNGWAGGID